jgi:hypothetical protein
VKPYVDSLGNEWLVCIDCAEDALVIPRKAKPRKKAATDYTDDTDKKSSKKNHKK